MHYISTRGEAPALGFADALLAGLARDGGLYTPVRSRRHGRRTQSARSRGLPYAEAAAPRDVARSSAAIFDAGRTRRMTEDAYRRLPPRREPRRSFRSTTICSRSSCSTGRRWRSRISPCNGSAGDEPRAAQARPSARRSSARPPATPARRRSRLSADSRRPTSSSSIRTGGCPTCSAGR